MRWTLALLSLTAAAQAAVPLAGAPPAQATRAGIVAQAEAAGRYCYLALEGPLAEWLVTVGACPAVGAQVEASVFAWRRDFRSGRLDRTFAKLGFATVTSKGGAR